MPKVKVGDINMYYEIHGKGEPLVFINGASSTVESKYERIPMYDKQFKCILFDNRGVGKTDAPDIPYTTKMMADDLAGLLDVIGISKTHILGSSLGGNIAQQFAIHYPERVNRLIIMGSYCGGSKSIPIPEEVVENIKNRFPQGIIPVGIMRQIETGKNHDTYENLSKITAPTLIISGDSDEVVPPENSKILASRIPNSELVILPNTGHLMLEAGNQPDILSIKFLKGEVVGS